MELNRAVYADENGQIAVQNLPRPIPSEDEMLIQVLYSGVNPADMKTVKSFDLRQHVLGNEFCGRVLELPTGSNPPFKVGDVVAGYVNGAGKRPQRYGTHQSYISIPLSGVFRVPDNLPYSDAAALTVVAQTANDALFNRFNIPLPLEVNGLTEGTLVIWGGATSVGMAAIQLARASRVSTIIAIASAQRHNLLKDIGATHCFDYKEKDVVDQVKAVVQEDVSGRIWGFDAVGVPGTHTLLANALSVPGYVQLATALPLIDDDRFEGCLGARHIDIVFDIPGQQTPFIIPSRPTEAERMWKALMWVVRNYGNEYQPGVVRIITGEIGDVVEEIAKVGDQGAFGKLVLKHPL